MIEADSKAIWNLPFFVPLKQLRTMAYFTYLIIGIFMKPSRYFIP